MRRISIVVLVLALASCGRGVVSRAPSPTSSTTDSHPFPDRFVAQMNDGRIVVARTADGSVERVLATRKGLIGFVVPDNGREVYVGPWVEGACFAVEKIPLDGSPLSEVLKRADRWDVSADGGSIMFASDGECGHTRYGFVIRDLANGSERHLSFAPKDRHDLIQVDGLHFLESKRYAYVTQCGADSCGPILVDLQKDRHISDSSFGCEKTGCTGEISGESNPDWFLSGLVNRGARGTIVSGVDYASSDPSSVTSPVIEIDPLTLKLIRILYRGRQPDGTSPNPEPIIPMSIVDFDASGENALMLGEKDSLYRWREGTEPVLIGDGFARAAW